MIEINQPIHLFLDWDLITGSGGVGRGTFHNDKYIIETIKGILEIDLAVTSHISDRNFGEIHELRKWIDIGEMKYFSPKGAAIPLTKENYNQVKEDIENILTYE